MNAVSFGIGHVAETRLMRTLMSVLRSEVFVKTNSCSSDSGLVAKKYRVHSGQTILRRTRKRITVNGLNGHRLF